MTRISGIAIWSGMIVITIFGIGCGSKSQNVGSAPKNDQAYTRVLQSGVIRCGYVVYPPGLLKDPNTGKLSGVFYDIMESAAKSLQLRLEWTEEVGWGSMIEGLQANRYDMICSPVWANSTRARLADFGPPIYFSVIGVYVRKGDKRFSGDLSKINEPTVRVATIDGEMSSIVTSADFPRAQAVSLPQLSDDSQLLLNVATKKADLTFVEPYIAALYSKNNPGLVENIVPDNPIRAFPTTIMFRKNEPSLSSMMTVAINEQINAGALEREFRKFNVPPDTLLPPAVPYRIENRGQK